MSDPVSKSLADEYKAACAMYEEAMAMKERIRQSLIETASYVGDYMCHGIKVSLVKAAGSIDYKHIPGVAKMVEDGTIEQYRKEARESYRVDIYG